MSPPVSLEVPRAPRSLRRSLSQLDQAYTERAPLGPVSAKPKMDCSATTATSSLEKSTATSAKSTASSAKSTTTSAKSTATSAKSAATSAKSTATSAKSTQAAAEKGRRTEDWSHRVIFSKGSFRMTAAPSNAGGRRRRDNSYEASDKSQSGWFQSSLQALTRGISTSGSGQRTQTCNSSVLSGSPLQRDALLLSKRSVDSSPILKTPTENTGSLFEKPGSWKEKPSSFKETMGSLREKPGSFKETMGSLRAKPGSFKETMGNLRGGAGSGRESRQGRESRLRRNSLHVERFSPVHTVDSSSPGTSTSTTTGIRRKESSNSDSSSTSTSTSNSSSTSTSTSTSTSRLSSISSSRNQLNRVTSALSTNNSTKTSTSNSTCTCTSKSSMTRSSSSNHIDRAGGGTGAWHSLSSLSSWTNGKASASSRCLLTAATTAERNSAGAGPECTATVHGRTLCSMPGGGRARRKVLCSKEGVSPGNSLIQPGSNSGATGGGDGPCSPWTDLPTMAVSMPLPRAVATGKVLSLTSKEELLLSSVGEHSSCEMAAYVTAGSRLGGYKAGSNVAKRGALSLREELLLMEQASQSAGSGDVLGDGLTWGHVARSTAENERLLGPRVLSRKAAPRPLPELGVSGSSLSGASGETLERSRAAGQAACAVGLAGTCRAGLSGTSGAGEESPEGWEDAPGKLFSLPVLPAAAATAFPTALKAATRAARGAATEAAPGAAPLLHQPGSSVSDDDVVLFIQRTFSRDSNMLATSDVSKGDPDASEPGQASAWADVSVMPVSMPLPQHTTEWVGVGPTPAKALPSLREGLSSLEGSEGTEREAREPGQSSAWADVSVMPLSMPLPQHPTVWVGVGPTPAKALPSLREELSSLEEQSLPELAEHATAGSQLDGPTAAGLSLREELLLIEQQLSRAELFGTGEPETAGMPRERHVATALPRAGGEVTLGPRNQGLGPRVLARRATASLLLIGGCTGGAAGVGDPGEPWEDAPGMPVSMPLTCSTEARTRKPRLQLRQQQQSRGPAGAGAKLFSSRRKGEQEGTVEPWEDAPGNPFSMPLISSTEAGAEAGALGPRLHLRHRLRRGGRAGLGAELVLSRCKAELEGLVEPWEDAPWMPVSMPLAAAFNRQGERASGTWRGGSQDPALNPEPNESIPVPSEFVPVTRAAAESVGKCAEWMDMPEMPFSMPVSMPGELPVSMPVGGMTMPVGESGAMPVGGTGAMLVVGTMPVGARAPRALRWSRDDSSECPTSEASFDLVDPTLSISRRGLRTQLGNTGDRLTDSRLGDGRLKDDAQMNIRGSLQSYFFRKGAALQTRESTQPQRHVTRALGQSLPRAQSLSAHKGFQGPSGVSAGVQGGAAAGAAAGVGHGKALLQEPWHFRESSTDSNYATSEASNDPLRLRADPQPTWLSRRSSTQGVSHHVTTQGVGHPGKEGVSNAGGRLGPSLHHHARDTSSSTSYATSEASIDPLGLGGLSPLPSLPQQQHLPQLLWCSTAAGYTGRDGGGGGDGHMLGWPSTLLQERPGSSSSQYATSEASVDVAPHHRRQEPVAPPGPHLGAHLGTNLGAHLGCMPQSQGGGQQQHHLQQVMAQGKQEVQLQPQQQPQQQHQQQHQQQFWGPRQVQRALDYSSDSNCSTSSASVDLETVGHRMGGGSRVRGPHQGLYRWLLRKSTPRSELQEQRGGQRSGWRRNPGPAVAPATAAAAAPGFVSAAGDPLSGGANEISSAGGCAGAGDCIVAATSGSSPSFDCAGREDSARSFRIQRTVSEITFSSGDQGLAEMSLEALERGSAWNRAEILPRGGGSGGGKAARRPLNSAVAEQGTLYSTDMVEQGALYSPAGDRIGASTVHASAAESAVAGIADSAMTPGGDSIPAKWEGSSDPRADTNRNVGSDDDLCSLHCVLEPQTNKMERSIVSVAAMTDEEGTDEDLCSLHCKLELLQVQRKLSAVRCQTFLDALEEHSANQKHGLGDALPANQMPGIRTSESWTSGQRRTGRGGGDRRRSGTGPGAWAATAGTEAGAATAGAGARSATAGAAREAGGSRSGPQRLVPGKSSGASTAGARANSNTSAGDSNMPKLVPSQSVGAGGKSKSQAASYKQQVTSSKSQAASYNSPSGWSGGNSPIVIHGQGHLNGLSGLVRHPSLPVGAMLFYGNSDWNSDWKPTGGLASVSPTCRPFGGPGVGRRRYGEEGARKGGSRGRRRGTPAEGKPVSPGPRETLALRNQGLYASLNHQQHEGEIFDNVKGHFDMSRGARGMPLRQDLLTLGQDSTPITRDSVPMRQESWTSGVRYVPSLGHVPGSSAVGGDGNCEWGNQMPLPRSATGPETRAAALRPAVPLHGPSTGVAAMNSSQANTGKEGFPPESPLASRHQGQRGCTGSVAGEDLRVSPRSKEFRDGLLGSKAFRDGLLGRSATGPPGWKHVQPRVSFALEERPADKQPSETLNLKSGYIPSSPLSHPEDGSSALPLRILGSQKCTRECACDAPVILEAPFSARHVPREAFSGPVVSFDWIKEESASHAEASYYEAS